MPLLALKLIFRMFHRMRINPLAPIADHQRLEGMATGKAKKREK
jgi:hypothetical protein